MSEIVEVDVLKNWTLSIDHFYSMVKASLGEISQSGKYQIQAAAIPLDIDTENYEWFSRGNINLGFDVALEPLPVSDALAGGLEVGTKLSEEYEGFLTALLDLVEDRELTDDEVAKIDKLKTEIENLGEEETKLSTTLLNKWKAHCDATLTDKGDKVAHAHWVQGQSESYELKNVRVKRKRKIAQKIGLSSKEYENPDHKAVVDAYMKFVSPAAQMRYPRFEDTTYGAEERAKFNVTYFASMPAHSSNQFINTYMMTPTVSLETIANSSFGSFSSTITSTSEASDSVKTDWSYSGSVGYGPFKAKHKASSKEKIEEEFSNVSSMNVSVKSLVAIPFNADTWFTPSIFKNPLVQENADLFERWLGEEGTLRVVPTHLVVCRGFKLTFTNAQEWQYDYESDFKAGGGGSASVMGISFGARGKYHKHVERQRIEKRGHDLVFDDGEDNIRILGYHTVTNLLRDDFDDWVAPFNKATKLAKKHADLME